MNDLLRDIHVIVFLKKRQSRTNDLLVQSSKNKRRDSCWKGYKQLDYNPLINWIEAYPDRGIRDLVEAKNEQLLLFKGMYGNQSRQDEPVRHTAHPAKSSRK